MTMKDSKAPSFQDFLNQEPLVIDTTKVDLKTLLTRIMEDGIYSKIYYENKHGLKYEWSPSKRAFICPFPKVGGNWYPCSYTPEFAEKYLKKKYKEIEFFVTPQMAKLIEEAFKAAYRKK